MTCYLLPWQYQLVVGSHHGSDIIGLTTLCVGASPVSSWKDSRYLLTDDRAQSNDRIGP